MTRSYPPVFDGHNDTILDLHLVERGAGRSFFERSDSGHIDLPRAQQGGLGGGFFALFVPAKATKKKKQERTRFPGEEGAPDEGPISYKVPPPKPLKHNYALNFALALMDRLYSVEQEADGAVKIVRTADEIEACLADGTLAMILHFEGAEAIDVELHALPVFYHAGLRSLGLVWSRSNRFGHGVPFNFPGDPDSGPGLTEAGKELVARCNGLGILVDLSHLNEKGFWDVAALSEAPLVATHSGVHALCPTPRNLTDKQLDAIRDSNGLVGINFHVGFLRPDGRLDKKTTVAAIADHVDYVVTRIGLDHVAFGSDFDGAQMPDDMQDVAGLPLLMAELRTRGYDDAALTQIAHGNWLRVLRATWK